MSGTTVVKFPTANNPTILTITPTMAMELLEANTLNRPLSHGHVERIAAQIAAGAWRFNGDTIKIADTGDVLDGQHRLWAIVESKTAIETILVRGIHRDAFATIDTIRKPRSLGDTVALSGTTRYRSTIGGALAWLLRWQGKFLEDYKAPKNRIENAHIEKALADNPSIVRAVERIMHLRSIGNTSVLGFLFYIVDNRSHELAERLIDTLTDPAGVGVNDPIYKLRAYFVGDHHKKKSPITTIALAIKAINAANEGKKIQVLSWRNTGKMAEEFPKLRI